MAKHYKKLDSLTYPLNPDAAYFCPFSPFYDLLLVGLYTLENTETQKVIGGVSLFDTHHSKLTEVASLQSISGVLDLKWYRQDGNILYFVLACVDCKIILCKSESNMISIVDSLELNSKCLYVDVYDHYIVTSLDNGGVALIQEVDGSLQLEHQREMMKFQAWSCALEKTPKEGHCIYLSGGDDAKLFLSDSRMDLPVSVSSKSHEAGITHIEGLPKDNLFFTCSFDSHIRIFDIRNIRNEVSRYAFEGPVWRAVYHPFSLLDAPGSLLDTLLVGVYSEFKYEMVSVDQNLNMQDTGLIYDQHTSLTYGLDIKRGSQEVGSISFYDNQIHLWNFF